MRRVSRDRGFLISLLFNMAFRVEWAVIGIVLLIVHHFFEKVPLWAGLAAFAIWFLISFFVTLLLSTANRLGNHKDPVRENKNPYSVKSVPMGRSENDVSSEDERLCPCCHKYRFDEVGKYEICPICGWEDDPIARKDPSFAGGANKMSLNEARSVFLNKKKEEI